MADYTTPTTGKLPNEKIEEIKKRSGQIENAHAAKLELFQRYREIYFMDNAATPKNAGVDRNDWKITTSPAGRNAVTGMKRLLDTSEINVTIKSGDDTIPQSNDIERGLMRILQASGEMKRARVEKDANLSAVLWGPVGFRVESVDDLLLVQKRPAFKKRMQRIRERTPFLISVMNAEESFPDWGRYGMLAHVEKYKANGQELKEVWGVTECKDEREYIVHDYMDIENRVVWAEGLQGTLFAGPHNLPDMNVFVRYSGGSSLFWNPEEQLQSFLFAMAKGRLDERDNLLLTYIFTAIYQQGLPGKTLLVDNTEGTQPTVDIDYASGVKKIIVSGARAQMTDLSVIDGDVVQLMNKVDEMISDSTIRGQTLGDNIAGATFSALAMLSSAGKLPLIDPTEAIEQAFEDVFDHILTRIRDEGIENDMIPPADIPERFEVIVSMKPKLPQDDLRNAQVAAQLGDKVSDEWIHENLLQVGDTEAMHKQIAKEQIRKAMVGQLIQNPQYMEKFMQAVMGQPPQPPRQPQPPTAPPGMEEMMQQQSGMPPQGPPQGQPTPEQMAMMMQGGGAEGMPQGGPMIPPEERM